MSQDPFIDHMERRCGCYDQEETPDIRRTLKELHAANNRIRESVERIEKNNRELKAWLDAKGLSKPNPKAFRTEGPRYMQFTAYDPSRFDVCGDADCRCRSGRNNIRGFGATEQEALEDFWQQWEEEA